MQNHWWEACSSDLMPSSKLKGFFVVGNHLVVLLMPDLHYRSGYNGGYVVILYAISF